MHTQGVQVTHTQDGGVMTHNRQGSGGLSTAGSANVPTLRGRVDRLVDRQDTDSDKRGDRWLMISPSVSSSATSGGGWGVGKIHSQLTAGSVQVLLGGGSRTVGVVCC